MLPPEKSDFYIFCELPKFSTANHGKILQLNMKKVFVTCFTECIPQVGSNAILFIIKTAGEQGAGGMEKEPIKSHEDLEVYKMAFGVAMKIFEFSKNSKI
ncbi:hypothetical protein [Nostoc sp. 2RC]|uniref:hypothetical protein n=1 Tax=Nostoc sp. 2RC TaxID=2485484 RepID=UPI0021AB36AE|nr:hypothetical protein [Nostoc sp. 2RC]